MSVAELARRARAASRDLATSTGAARDAVLCAAAGALRAAQAEILAANAADVAAASDIDAAALARLSLSPAKVEQMALGLEALAGLTDPLGQISMDRVLDDDLELVRVSVPIGVLGIIFESRPDAAIQIGGLGIKSGNAVLLKGGSEAAQTVTVLVRILQQALADGELNPDAVLRLDGREAVDELLTLSGEVDLIIPRGSGALVKSIQERTRIPVLGHAEGICHAYVDAAADPAMAIALVHDAKVQYPAACNAIETLLIHRDARAVLPLIVADLESVGVRLRGDEATRELVDVAPATDADWDTEYGDLELSIAVVDDLDAAIAHIGAHGSGHTELIITDDVCAASEFLARVDAAGVYHNASTRFADGFRYGFGAEVGISTGRIHARGPVGLEGLVTQKYLLRGTGQVVASYAGEQPRPFLHRDRDTLA